MAIYVDTSAALKFLIAEPETAALVEWRTATAPMLIGSDLLRTELLRAIRRTAHPVADSERAAAWLHTITIMPLTRSHFEAAGHLEPVTIRSLDALHLAAALDLGADCSGVVTYDQRLGAAARELGLDVIAPS